MKKTQQNHNRFSTWREAITAFANEWIDAHPESATMPLFVLDHAMLEWLYEDAEEDAK